MQQQMGPQAQQNPQFMQLNQQVQAMTTSMEQRKAQLIAEFTNDYATEEKKVLNQIENDPLLKLKDRELDLKAREEQRRAEDEENQLALDRAKMLQQRDLSEQKMEENDKHQKLRASVSLAKSGITGMQATIKEQGN